MSLVTWEEKFNLWAKAKEGLLHAGLYWIIWTEATHDFSVTPAPAFLPGKCHVGGTKDITEMIMLYTSHQDYRYDHDNGLIFDALKHCFGGTDYETILSHDQHERDGRGALLKIIRSNTPDGQRFDKSLSLLQNL